jgi:hypothetical protein
MSAVSGRLGRISVNAEHLLKRLGLPTDARLTDLRWTDHADVLEMVVMHPDLREVASGALIPIYVPTFVTNNDGDQHMLITWGESR